MMALKLGPGPTLEAALESVARVGALVGGARARLWAVELKDIAARLSEGNPRGPKGVSWPTEAARLQLAADVAEHGYERNAALMGAKALADRLPGMEAAADNTIDRLEVAAIRLELEATIGAEHESMKLDPKRRHLAGKAFSGWSRDKERAFMRLIRRVGGYVPDGGRAGSPLDYDSPHVERAMQLVSGEAEPGSDGEHRALEIWRKSTGESP